MRTGGAVLAVLAVLTLAPPEANAGCCSCAWSASRSAARTVVTKVNARIDRLESSIVRTLELQTAQLSGYIAEGAKSITEALDAQTKLQAEIARDEAETQSKLQHRPTSSGCRTVTGMAGLAEGRAAGGQAGEKAGARETGRIGGDSAVVGDGAGMAADTKQRFGVWTREHCDPARLKAGADVCEGDPRWHDADLKAGSVFDVDTFKDADERLAAEELGKNLAAPVSGMGPVSAARRRYRPGPRARDAGAFGGCALGACVGLVCPGARRARAGCGPGGVGVDIGARSCR